MNFRFDLSSFLMLISNNSVLKRIMTFLFRIAALSLISTLCFVTSKSAAQVFDVDVSLNMDQISSESDYQYIADLESELEDYIEDGQWTDDRFQDFERITMRMQIIINSVEDSEFSANLVVTSNRPIYNTMQLSPVVLINDSNWSFEYNRGQNLIHDENRHDDLTSVIDYYAYMVLGFDYDTYSPLGGNRFFRRAERIVDLAESSGATGWGGSGGSSRRTRYHLVNYMTSQNYEPLREAMYVYHRRGLDKFIEDTEEARENALEAFEMIDEARRNTSDNYAFDIIMDNKYREFTNFFIDASSDIRISAYNILRDIDRSNDDEYEKLQF